MLNIPSDSLDLKSFKYILFISLLWFCLGCSLTRNLEPNQYVVYENNLTGVSQADEEDLYALIDQEPNTRFLGTSIGVVIYRLGDRFYDQEKISLELEENRTKLKQVNEQLDTLSDSRKLEKKAYKLTSKIQSLEKKEEFGNGLMRTGNPVVILDSALTRKTVSNLKGYLINHGFSMPKSVLKY